MLRLSLGDVRTPQDAHALYREAIRLFDCGMIEYIEANPQEQPGDTDKVRSAKDAYRKWLSFSAGGAVHKRQSEIA